MYKITGADGKEYGPVTTEQLRQWIAEGRVNAQTRILAEGATEWRTLSELPEFAGAIPTAPPPGLTTAPMPSPGAQAQVSGPATGLIVVAILGFLAQPAGLIINMARPNRQIMEQPAWVNMFSGVGAIVGAAIGILMGILIIFGAIK